MLSSFEAVSFWVVSVSENKDPELQRPMREEQAQFSWR